MGSSPASERSAARAGGLREEAASPRTKVVLSPKARAWVVERGGEVWVWLDPRRGLVGSYVWLEAHCEAPGSSKRSPGLASTYQ